MIYTLILGAAVVVVVILVIVVIFAVKRRKKHMSILKDCGIPGPSPHFFSGNLNEALSQPNVLFDNAMVERYGPIFGYYLGAKPVVFISDPELIEEVLYTKKDIFCERPRRVPGGINPDPKRSQMLGNLPFKKWKTLRNVVARAFTPRQLRNIVPTITNLVDIFLHKVSTMIDDSCQEMDMYELFQELSLDIIGHTGFGINSNIQGNGEDQFLRAVQSEFGKSTSSTLIKFYLCFPEISWIVYPIRRIIQFTKEKFNMCPSLPLWKQGFAALESRRNGNASNDLLHQLLQAQPALSTVQIVANSVLFFEAGYETTASILGILVHLIANHPMVQFRIRQELRQIWVNMNDREQNTHVLDYLTAVIHEGLRMFPPQTTFVGRSPIVDVTLHGRNGSYTIPKDCHVQIGLVQVQNSPDYWTHPEIFNPERFMPGGEGMENMRKFKWIAFGAGPRVCVGRTFAMNNIRLVLAKLLSKYMLNPSPITPNIIMEYKIATMTPKCGSFVIVEILPAYHPM